MINPFSGLKQINVEIVRQIAESLMLLNGKTTTLEVKLALREEGYYALQSEVSAYLSAVAAEMEWYFQFNGTYRRYFLEPVAGNTVENMGREELAEELAAQAGLPTEIYLEYLPFFKQKAVRCRLSYHGVHKTERQQADFILHDQISKGHFLWYKEAGYVFTFDVGRSKESLQHILRGASWDGLHYSQYSAFLLGERLLKERAFLFSGEEMGCYQLLRKQELEITRLQVFNSKLYRVEILFEDGQELNLKRSELDLKSELLPLARKILGQ